MVLVQSENLLPKRLTDRVALKTLVSQHQLSRSRGFRKLSKILCKKTIARTFLGVSFIFYFSGYQPTLAIPPIKQAMAEAEFTQEQDISTESFPEAFSLPHPGYLTTRFSSWHPGVDIASGYGMPVHPIASGKVVEVTISFWGLGHYVVIEHEQGFRSTYGHMSKIYVKNGDSVEASSTLGEVGTTGHTTGPHTHLEVTKNGQLIDPLTILPAIANWPAAAGAAPSGTGKAQEKAKTPKERPAIIPLNLTKGRYSLTKPEGSKTNLLPRPLESQPGQSGSRTALFPD